MSGSLGHGLGVRDKYLEVQIMYKRIRKMFKEVWDMFQRARDMNRGSGTCFRVTVTFTRDLGHESDMIQEVRDLYKNARDIF